MRIYLFYLMKEKKNIDAEYTTKKTHENINLIKNHKIIIILIII